LSNLDRLSTAVFDCGIYSNRACATTIELLQKGTPEFVPPQLCTPNRPDLNPVGNSMWEILQETLYRYKTRIIDLELSAMPMTNGCHNDDMIQLCPLCSQSLFQFVQFSDAYFVHLVLQ